MSVRTIRAAAIAAGALAFSQPAFAHPESLPGPESPQDLPAGAVRIPGYDQAAWQQARGNWLVECRRRHGSGNRVGGAILGSVIGGVIGNRVAGDGDRALGTVAGAAVGAVAGGAIGDAADRQAGRDWCESYLDDYLARQTAPAYPGHPVVGYGQAPMLVMVPVAYVQAQAAPAPPRECVETIVTEDTLPAAQPMRSRRIAPRAKPAPDKRVRIN